MPCYPAAVLFYKAANDAELIPISGVVYRRGLREAIAQHVGRLSQVQFPFWMHFVAAYHHRGAAAVTH